MKTLLSSLIVLSSLSASATPSPAVVGLRKAFATAYQSCESLRLKPIDGKTSDVEGVENNGSYPDSWTGKYVKITDVASILRTHYYIHESHAAPGCLDIQKYPMVYDFGGKPNPAGGVLNYFKNSNGGSPGLGVDCSGFVFTALAVGGLRLKAGKTLTAAEVEEYPARMYIHPDRSGFSCLKPKSVGMTGFLKAGDILASKYHVAMVERVGEDPFGITKHANCSDISYSDFDFVIAQSSPDHNNIGINKTEAREYLSDITRAFFRWGLEKYAREACEANKNNTDVVPDSDDFGISTPKTTPECMQTPIKLQGQSCIDACPEINE